MSISDVQHQEAAIGMLQQALAGGRLAHGYVFCGPRGVGKRTTAVEFAKVLLCESPVTAAAPGGGAWRDSCGGCESCRLVAANTHPDYHWIYKELVTSIKGKERHKATDLGIDVIRRELIDRVGLKPGLGRAKVFVVAEAHKMSRSAQNALLKTLEEPPPATFIILLAEGLSMLVPTIRSRAHVVRFRLLPDAFVRARLGAAGADEARTDFLARFVPGQLGLALELLRQDVYDLNERLRRELASLDEATAADAVKWVQDEAKALAERIQGQGEDEPGPEVAEWEGLRVALRRIFALMSAFYDDNLRRAVGRPADAAAEAARRLQRKITSIREAQKYLDANVNQSTLLTDLFFRLAAKE